MERLFGTVSIATILCNFLEDTPLPNETSRAVWDFCINVPMQFLLATIQDRFPVSGERGVVVKC